MEHSNFIFKVGHLVKIGESQDIFHISERNADCRFPIAGDKGIGAEAAVSSEIEHIGRLGQKQGIDPLLSHQFPCTLDSLIKLWRPPSLGVQNEFFTLEVFLMGSLLFIHIASPLL